MTVELFTWGFVQWVEQAVTFQPAARDKGPHPPEVSGGYQLQGTSLCTGPAAICQGFPELGVGPTQGKGDADGEGARAEGETSPPRLNEQPQKPQNTHQPQV